jgi:hypothetical protein
VFNHRARAKIPSPPLMALSQLSLLETAMQLIFCHVFPEAMGKVTHDVGLHSRDIANQTHHSTTQRERVCKPNMYSLSLSLFLSPSKSFENKMWPGMLASCPLSFLSLYVFHSQQ